MLTVLLLVTPVCWGETPFTDSAGRRVLVPDEVKRVYAAGHPAAILLYSLAPEKLLGWTRRLPDPAAALLPARFRGLPVLGRLTGRGGTANVEVVLSTAPDLILDYGSVKPTFVSLADRVQAQTRVPVILLDGAFRSIPDIYRRLGDLLGVSQRAERLARYAERLMADVDRVASAVPQDERPRVYYARGPDGLETGRRGAINVEMLELVGAVNVAASTGSGNLATISLEQILLWDPDVIVTIDRHFAREVRGNPQWQALGAVRDGRIYLAPDLPFGWFDQPPSINRLMGIRWLLHVLYPARAEGQLREATREFFELFYHRRPGEEELDRILAPLSAAPS